jgi:hypothetical protein
MRTTLDIDDDVLQAAKERARQANSTAGRVISELARRGLTAPSASRSVREQPAVYGFKPLAPRGGIVTNELIDRLREDDAGG